MQITCSLHLKREKSIFPQLEGSGGSRLTLKKWKLRVWMLEGESAEVVSPGAESKLPNVESYSRSKVQRKALTYEIKL